jgi:hypothetical protein
LTGASVIRNVWAEPRPPLSTRIFYTTSDGSLHGIIENFPSPVPLWPPVSPPAGVQFTTMPAVPMGSGKIYVGRSDGRVQQLAADTGTLEMSAPVGTPGTLWDPTPGVSSAAQTNEDRLDITTTEGSISRFCIPWAVTGVAPVSTFSGLALAQNAPNPFSTNTRIGYRLPETARVEIEIFAIDGRIVRRLVREQETAGSHDAAWDGRDDAGRAVATGPYFYRMRVTSSDGRTREDSKKIQLVR